MTAVADIPPVWTERPARDRKSVKLATRTRPDHPIRINTRRREIVEWIATLLKGVSDIVQLPPEWNGPGSHTINRKNLEKLFRILFDIGAYHAPGPQLVPLDSGGVQAEWHFLKQSIEVGISAEGEIFAYATNEEGDYVVELEETWFIPRSDLFPLRRAILSYAERVAKQQHKG